MIPRYSKTYHMDTSYLSKSIGFKHGLMLLYQFIYFINEINDKGFHFGHLNFSNIYFIKNEGKKTTAKRTRSRNKGDKGRRDSARSNNSSGADSCYSSRTFRDAQDTKFTLDLLFIEKDLIGFHFNEKAQSKFIS